MVQWNPVQLEGFEEGKWCAMIHTKSFIISPLQLTDYSLLGRCSLCPSALPEFVPQQPLGVWMLWG